MKIKRDPFNIPWQSHQNPNRVPNWVYGKRGGEGGLCVNNKEECSCLGCDVMTIVCFPIKLVCCITCNCVLPCVWKGLKLIFTCGKADISDKKPTKKPKKKPKKPKRNSPLTHNQKITFVSKGVGGHIIQSLLREQPQLENMVMKFVFLDPFGTF